MYRQIIEGTYKAGEAWVVRRTLRGAISASTTINGVKVEILGGDGITNILKIGQQRWKELIDENDVENPIFRRYFRHGLRALELAEAAAYTKQLAQSKQKLADKKTREETIARRLRGQAK